MMRPQAFTPSAAISAIHASTSSICFGMPAEIHSGTILRHEHIILDTNADATVFRRNQQIILTEVQARFDGEDHARTNLGVLIRLITRLRAIMHVETQMVGHAAGEPTAMLLAFRESDSSTSTGRIPQSCRRSAITRMHA